MEELQIAKLRYILSSHVAYLEENIYDGNPKGLKRKHIDLFYLILDDAINKKDRTEVRNSLLFHIEFLENHLKDTMEIIELEGFKLICIEFIR